MRRLILHANRGHGKAKDMYNSRSDLAEVTTVAFDMRDPVRSGIARVARSMARGFAENNVAGKYNACFCGPIDQLHELGAPGWGINPPHLVPWSAGRLSIAAELEWSRVSMAVKNSVWYFPHWDVPWVAHPQRSIVLLSDVIPINVPGATSAMRRHIARRWIRRSGNVATRIAVSTEFTKGEVLDIWPDFRQKIRVVPLGVDPFFFQEPVPLPAKLQALAGRSGFMLSVGNRKTHKNLIMGPEVLARIPDLHWIVVGEPFVGWERVVARAETLQVGDRMHVLAPQPDTVLHSLYASSACLFFPSRNEGFGLPILEALASGTRVVAGAAGASIEVLGGHGAVCPLDDADAFAGAVNDARASGPPGADGRAHAARFTWKRSASRLAELVQEIVGAPVTTPRVV